MTPAGWYGDPGDPSQLRYWDGTAWTDHQSPLPPAAPTGIEAHVTRVGDRVVVAAAAIAAGLAPTACVPHRRTGATVPVKFASKAPLWVYLTVVVGLIWPVIISAILRKTVTAPAWPVCDQCAAERRRNQTWMWVSIGSWVPAFLLFSVLPSGTPQALSWLLIGVAALGPLIAAVWFSDRANPGRAVRGVVSPDGSTVSFPAKAFPRPVVAAHESRSAASSAPAGSSGTTYLSLQ